MPRYLETADQLRKEVESFLDCFVQYEGFVSRAEAAVQLGHIVNLAVRCSPRGVQHTVRKNIVATAMKKYCRVSMTQVMDETTGSSYYKITIVPRS